MDNVVHRPKVRRSSLAVIAVLLAGCSGIVAPTTTAPAVEDGLSGQVTIVGGPLEGTYAVEATPAETVCQRSGETWVIGFAKQALVEGVTTLQVAGSGEGENARLQDLFLTVGATTEENTVRLPGDASAVNFTTTDDQARATVDGTTSDGTEITLSLACAPLSG